MFSVNLAGILIAAPMFVRRTTDANAVREFGAEDGIRTRDPLLGKEVGLSAVLASSRP